MENPYSTAEIQSACGILRLPDELLFDILRSATSCSSRRLHFHPSYFAEIVSVSKTCRRFYSLITPVMYREMAFTVGRADRSYNSTKMSQAAMQRLQWTLKQNPELGRHCRSIHLRIHATAGSENASDMIPLSEDVEVEFLVAMRLLSSLTGTKKLGIFGNFNDASEIWQAISAAVRNMPSLEEAFLCHHCPGMATGPVCEVLSQARSLKDLTITEIIDTSVVDVSGVPKRRHPSLNRLLVEDSRCGIHDLKRLISWPCRLEHLLLVPAGNFENSYVPWGLEELGPVLESQKTTLRTLEIGPLDLQGLRGFDLTEFESLEELDLSYFSTGCEPGTEANLLAPKLRKFTWAFVFEAGWKCQMTCFEEAQENWLREFATGALAARLPLGCIHLSFVPEDYLPDFSVPRPKISPWDRVEQLRDEFHHLGIALTCSATREDYERLWTPVRRPEDGSHPAPESPVRPEGVTTQSNTILNYFTRI